MKEFNRIRRDIDQNSFQKCHEDVSVRDLVYVETFLSSLGESEDGGIETDLMKLYDEINASPLSSWPKGATTKLEAFVGHAINRDFPREELITVAKKLFERPYMPCADAYLKMKYS